ncbi:hypothetical protein [Ferrimicrobium sp.]|jgi:hypothetical protein|uniref:hypothetical protein n=1 Tax=Ferrimicrobium sp. TaxID=2926050 RepID=UPI00262E8709|nr:hypothetical protein [Ferrimicrobium sp.]
MAKELRDFRVVAFEHFAGLNQLMGAERFEDLEDAGRTVGPLQARSFGYSGSSAESASRGEVHG